MGLRWEASVNSWFNDLKRDGENPILNCKVYTMQCLRILETMILGESKFDDIHCAQIDDGCYSIGNRTTAKCVSLRDKESKTTSDGAIINESICTGSIKEKQGSGDA